MLSVAAFTSPPSVIHVLCSLFTQQTHTVCQAPCEAREHDGQQYLLFVPFKFTVNHGRESFVRSTLQKAGVSAQ